VRTLLVVIHRLDRLALGRDEVRDRTRVIQRLARRFELYLLDTVGREDGDFPSLKSCAHVMLPSGVQRR
jgi:hypothetical protein